jgi:8-oxo-dGTP pyrophosphatase MutT (NUDIX family)
MPRFLVERTFPQRLEIPVSDDGTAVVEKVCRVNAESGVTWVHSYVSADKKKTYCIYDGPNEAAIRETAERNGLPVDSVVPVTVLDPYFYH